MEWIDIHFPSDSRVDEPYRGRKFFVSYEIRSSDGGIDFKAYVNGRELTGRQDSWVFQQVLERNKQPPP